MTGNGEDLGGLGVEKSDFPASFGAFIREYDVTWPAGD